MRDEVYNGIDVINKYKSIFEGKRIGLITGPTGVNKDLQSTIDIFNDAYDLRALYSPEHGIRGDQQAGVKIQSTIDGLTGKKVYSLYGKNRKPSKEMLSDIDVMVIDLQDIGSRYYTYMYTMAYAMQGCKDNNIKFVVLDRVNPVGGAKIEGNMLKSKYSSFVGMYPIANRHGLTMGELALMFNEEFDIRCDLEIIKVKGWSRDMYYDDTDLTWVSPSPNIPIIDTTILYNGMCFFEGTNISEGRGTTKPFHMIGAPFINPYKLSDDMNNKGHHGVRFRPVFFQPTFSKFKNELCKGVEIHIDNRHDFNAVEVGVSLLYQIKESYAEEFEFLKTRDRYFIDLLSGSDELRKHDYDSQQLLDRWNKELEAYSIIKNKYQLY